MKSIHTLHKTIISKLIIAIRRKIRLTFLFFNIIIFFRDESPPNIKIIVLWKTKRDSSSVYSDESLLQIFSLYLYLGREETRLGRISRTDRNYFTKAGRSRMQDLKQ
jgi:hypothetical protein